MLYYLFNFLDQQYDLPGAGLFQYISFRAGAAAVLSLLITIIFGKRLIAMLRRKQVGEDIRDLGLAGQLEKKGTPTMGGLIIILAIVLPAFLFARIDNVYIALLITTTLWLGAIGFADDYIKVFKKNKAGLAGKFKVVGQVSLGLIVGLTLFYHKDVKIREFSRPIAVEESVAAPVTFQDVKSNKTNIPFVKNNELDYDKIFGFLGSNATPILFILWVVLIVTAVSNGVNITDGLDGLAAGTSAIVGTALAIFAYISGNAIFSQYLNVMYIPGSGELVIFCAAFVGACVGFLWYNAFPAQVFMGDTGSLSIGGVIAVLALAVRKELIIPLLCGIFLIENLSVIIQVSYFRYTKRKYGEGRRIFKMSPLHHHYQKMEMHESKIVTRFWIAGILLAILSVATLKVR
jgi:phospho-N-acetylmuramoyl-pentapeptide-transferase